MLRPIIAVAAAVFLTLTLASTEASARFGGGFHGGGFHGGGFRGGFGGFRGGFHHHGFRHFGPRVAFGAPFLYAGYASYPYTYGDCLAPRRVWTPYGWRIRWVNVCY
jgi:hypothetical protein